MSFYPARHFLTRALLSARNLVDAQAILRDSGTGSSHGFCVNMAFTKQVFDKMLPILALTMYYRKFVPLGRYNSLPQR